MSRFWLRPRRVTFGKRPGTELRIDFLHLLITSPGFMNSTHANLDVIHLQHWSYVPLTFMTDPFIINCFACTSPLISRTVNVVTAVSN